MKGPLEFRLNGISIHDPINLRWIYINEEDTFGEIAKCVVYFKVIYIGLGAATDNSKFGNFFHSVDNGKEYLYSAEGICESIFLVKQ